MLKHLLILGGLSLIIGCTSAPTTDFNPDSNFSALRSYQLEEQSDPTSLDLQRMQQALTQQLAIKGFIRSDANADLKIRFGIKSITELQSYGSSFGIGYGSRNVGVGIRTPQQYREISYGKLIIEVINQKSNQVIWQAMSNKQLNQSLKGDERRQFIDAQVTQMMHLYPVHSVQPTNKNMRIN
ncbi:DUF4136 domain-containing protein [Thaumasiovibrio sp. DFM-14]|uniref:DUF4136 domain-containing protein n=1 Tax=Thaumasiovibrio sp. DFM-14 TaxID=3384792 RepID=UPI0039A2835D